MTRFSWAQHIQSTASSSSTKGAASTSMASGTPTKNAVDPSPGITAITPEKLFHATWAPMARDSEMPMAGKPFQRLEASRA